MGGCAGYSDVDSRFAATLPCTGVTRTPLAVSSANRNVSATPTNAGRTRFVIEVNFNRCISSVNQSAHDALLRGLLRLRTHAVGCAPDGCWWPRCIPSQPV